MADVSFQKPEVIISQPWIEILQVDFTLHIGLRITYELELRRPGHHLEKAMTS